MLQTLNTRTTKRKDKMSKIEEMSNKDKTQAAYCPSGIRPVDLSNAKPLESKDDEKTDCACEYCCPSGIPAEDLSNANLCEPEEIHKEDNVLDQSVADVGAAAAAASADGCKIKPEDIVVKDGTADDSYKVTIDLIEKLREIIRITFHHASEVSLLFAFAHWYGELMPFATMRSIASNVNQWADGMQLLAAAVTQIEDLVCGKNVDIHQLRQNSLELCYSVRWPVPLSLKHSSSNFCRGSHGVVVANAERFAEVGWLDKETWAFKPECSEDVVTAIKEQMKNLSMATTALKMAIDRFRRQRLFSDLNKLHEYLFYDVPPLAMPSFPDYLWRMYQILTVFMNPNYSDKRRYSKDDQALEKRLTLEEIEEETKQLALRIKELSYKK